ncbi:MAG: TrbC/VirB2 family protein [Candidatus Diapherotrites archaeon]
MNFKGGIILDGKRILCFLASVFLMLGPVFAASADMDKIKEPIDNLITLVQYIVGGFATLGFFGAAVAYMVAGSNIQAREGAKVAATCCVGGLVLVAVAPALVQFLTASGTGGI